jgi:Ribosomal protein S6e
MFLGSSGFKCHRAGQRRRKSVRGCIVGRDLAVVNCVIVDKGGNETAGFTDVNLPRRLGPKRANKIRKMYGLPRHFDLKNKKTDKKSKVEVDRFDVTRYVIKRPTKTVDGKSYYKVK